MNCSFTLLTPLARVDSQSQCQYKPCFQYSMPPLCHLEHCFFLFARLGSRATCGRIGCYGFTCFERAKVGFMQEWIETNGTWWHLFFDVGLAFQLVKLSIAFIAGSHTVFGFIRDKGSLCRLSSSFFPIHNDHEGYPFQFVLSWL